MKIQRKILIIISSLVIFVGTSSIFISRFIATNTIKQQISDNLLATTQSRAKHIETILNQYANVAKTLATENTFCDVVDEKVYQISKTEQLDRRITNIIESHPEISRIRVLNKKGTIVASSHEDMGIDEGTHEIFLKGKLSVFRSDLHLSSFTHKYVLSIAAPILMDNQFAGILVVNFDADKELFQITSERIGLGKTGEVYLVNKEGYMISPSRFIGDVILKQKIDMEHLTDPSHLKDLAGIVRDYRGEKVLSMHASIPEMGWILIAEIDASEAFTPVAKLTNTLFLTLGLIIFISMMISGFISGTIIRPLKKLYGGTKEITGGNLGFKISTRSPDEIGELSRAFNEMTGNLKKSREKLEEYSKNLEKKVEERTRALEEDINIRKEFEKVLRKEKEFTDTLIDTAQAIVLVLDKEGNILRFNQFMEELSGYQLAEVKGKSWFNLFLIKKDRMKIQKIFLKAIEGIQSKNNVNSILTKDGREVEIEWHDRILKDENEKTIGLLAIGLDITERKVLQKALQESEERLSYALNATNDGIWDWDLSSDKLYLSDQYCRMLGYYPGEIEVTSNKGFEDLLHPDDKKQVMRRMQECIEGRKKDYSAEFRMKSKSGRWIWILSRGNVVSRDINGKALRFLGTHVDISPRKQMEEALRSSNEKFANLFQNNPEAAVYTDENGNILDINNRFSELFGYELDEIKGKNINSGIIHSPGKLEEGRELHIKTLKEAYFSFETIRKKKDGTLLPVHITASSISIEGSKKGLIVLYQDITQRKKMEKSLEKLARFDSLTGIYNRGYGLELLSRQIKLSKRNKSTLLIAFLDIDGFKYINDNFGHDEGDRVLKKVTKLFKSTLREVDIICRMGGDEFLLIFPDNSLGKAPLIKERLNKDVIQLNQTIKKNYQIMFSIGFSEYNFEKPLSINDLIRIADQSMYDEKKKKDKF